VALNPERRKPRSSGARSTGAPELPRCSSLAHEAAAMRYWMPEGDREEGRSNNTN
jgi:hypothetical protein